MHRSMSGEYDFFDFVCAEHMTSLKITGEAMTRQRRKACAAPSILRSGDNRYWIRTSQIVTINVT